MTTKVSLGLAFFWCSAAWAADNVPLAVKPGQWESTHTSQTTGLRPIPPEVLAKMQPEQRAKMEERMKATPRRAVHRSCVKQEELNKPLGFGDDQKSCTRTVVTASPSKQEIRVECAEGNRKSSGIIRVEAINSENVKGSVHMTTTAGDRTMTIDSNFAAKWLGPTCSEK